MRTRFQRRCGRLALLMATSLAVGSIGCSSDDPPASPSPSKGSTQDSTTSSEQPEPRPAEAFTGTLDDFYRVPDPLPAGKPGELIRTMPIGAPDGTATHESRRIMYHSEDVLGRDRAVTGVVTYPTADAPSGGWPVISSAHGTTGLVSACAPSRSATSAPAFGIEGVSVATDYIGLGPVGEVHSYLSGVDEANSVIDAVRAARNVAEAKAGTRWVVWGHSQGGHAALFANELGQSRAPELDLAGTVAIAPAAELAKTYGPVDEIVTNIVSVMALYGAAETIDEIDPSDYVSAPVAEAATVMETQCLGAITAAFLDVPHDGFYEHHPLDTEPARSVFLANEPGTVAVDAPLLLVQGDQDIRVHPQRTEDLFTRLCAQGQVTDYLVQPGTDHDTVIGASAAEVTTWLTERLEAKPAPDQCPSDTTPPTD